MKSVEKQRRFLTPFRARRTSRFPFLPRQSDCFGLLWTVEPYSVGSFSTGGEAMLVLTRRIGEEVVINEDIYVTVLAIRGNRVRLGIEAPLHTSVDRRELHERRIAQRTVYKSSPTERAV
jgi:carbon storage regulator